MFIGRTVAICSQQQNASASNENILHSFASLHLHVHVGAEIFVIAQNTFSINQVLQFGNANEWNDTRRTKTASSASIKFMNFIKMQRSIVSYVKSITIKTLSIYRTNCNNICLILRCQWQCFWLPFNQNGC